MSKNYAMVRRHRVKFQPSISIENRISFPSLIPFTHRKKMQNYTFSIRAQHTHQPRQKLRVRHMLCASRHIPYIVTCP